MRLINQSSSQSINPSINQSISRWFDRLVWSIRWRWPTYHSDCFRRPRCSPRRRPSAEHWWLWLGPVCWAICSGGHVASFRSSWRMCAPRPRCRDPNWMVTGALEKKVTTMPDDWLTSDMAHYWDPGSPASPSAHRPIGTSGHAHRCSGWGAHHRCCNLATTPRLRRWVRCWGRREPLGAATDTKRYGYGLWNGPKQIIHTVNLWLSWAVSAS